MKDAEVIWFTGMSGAGKTTLATIIISKLKSRGLSSLILDGDKIRDSYPIPLGFERKDIRINNLNIAEICKIERTNYDVIIVPIISPIDDVREEVKLALSPKFSLVYLSAPINILKERDTKGLYKLADSGQINNLVGYSSSNPYDIPLDPDLILDVSGVKTEIHLAEELYEFIIYKMTT